MTSITTSIEKSTIKTSPLSVEKKGFLTDVAFIRLSLIFLLIFYHAFCPFTGAWDPIGEDVMLYKWFGIFTHHFRLETMVFISGLLFGYTITRKPERLCFQSCVIKKVKRILLPCLIFSSIYYLMFYELDVHPIKIVVSIINGCGHLWFLPMIFWCFVLTYALEKFVLSPKNQTTKVSSLRIKYIIAIAIVVAIASVPFKYFGLGHLVKYYIYFIFGYSIMRGYINLKRVSKKNILLFILLYIISVFSYEILAETKCEILLLKIIRIASLRLLGIICAFLMIFVLYNIANLPKIKNFLDNTPLLITLSGYCYGVYIYQQFILKIIYYQNPFSFHINTILLPWIGLTLTLVISLLLCHLTLKTKIGRYLIG